MKIILSLIMVLFVYGSKLHPVATMLANTTNDTVYANRLWYKQPASHWNEALPIGNGRMGAMIFGGVAAEHLQLNEQTLWSGAPRNWNNPGAKKYLALVRAAVADKNYKLADSLSKFMQGPYTESYLPMADLIISYKNIQDSLSYTRQLDIGKALSTVDFSSGGHDFTRTAFASFPDRAIIYHDTSNFAGAISYSVGVSSKLHYTLQTIDSNHILLKGKCPLHVDPVYLWKIKDSLAIQYAKDSAGEGMNFELHLMVRTTGGTVSTKNNRIIVEGADAATLMITAATSYNGFDKSPGLQGKNPAIASSNDMKKLSAISYQQLLSNHLKDYTTLFNRVTLNLGESMHKDLATDERMRLMDTYTDPEMLATIFQYGRYLLIAGSRPGGQPVNLKGIWNDKVRPEFSSNWCIDHDAQMFYYPVETTNLTEMHNPFLQFIQDLSVNGKQTAAVNYGMQGWCAHHNTDIWRQSAPVGNYGDGNPHWANWNMSGPWLCSHLFDHYLFTGDTAFLREKAWPVMKGAALFCLNWLSKDSNGLLMASPSVSPENTFITMGGDTAMVSRNSTIDIALIKELFTHCLATIKLLHTDKELAQRINNALQLLPIYRIGSKGQLLEWEQEWQPIDPSHRHLSHLYPVFPGSEISMLHTPALAIAAKKALSMRTKTNSSWGFAWKAACWARLGEGDSAWNTLQYQLHFVDACNKSGDVYGLFPNLFNSEGSSVILNGNGCATAVLTEMLLQSHTGEIQLLPALPHNFNSGAVSGLFARGGFVVDIIWSSHMLQQASIHAVRGTVCRLQYSSPFKIYEGDKEVSCMKADNNIIVFNTIKGHDYIVRPDLTFKPKNKNR